MRSPLLVKAVLFRLIVVAVDFVILSFVLESLVLSGIVTLVRHVIQVLLYWYHERAWQRHRWGIRRGRPTRRRALAKTVTFRLLTFGKDLLAITVFSAEFWGNLVGSLAIALANSVIYFVFERVWASEDRG
ncbi:MAG: DUF2061 domain-containing protein [bacterium]